MAQVIPMCARKKGVMATPKRCQLPTHCYSFQYIYLLFVTHSSQNFLLFITKPPDFTRKATLKLVAWRDDPNRKPLLLRGARQVGKTTLVNMFAGEQGRLRSMHQFVERADHPYAVRLYSNKLNIQKSATPGGKEYLLLNLPYYLAGKLPQYLEWFIQGHRL